MAGTAPAAAGDAHEFRRAQRADGPAAVLAIGTANPANCVPQDEYADFYFRVTKSEHRTQLKAKMKTVCENSGIKRRYFHHTEQLLLDHPEILDCARPSLDVRLDLVAAAVPELGAAAAKKAIGEWGRPAADITHLVVSTSSGARMPGPDLRLASLLGLRPSVQRTMIYFHAWSGGAGALRVAKDIAENSRGARVLVVCVELTLPGFRAPDEEDLVGFGQTLFGDGAAAVVVGADPREAVERPVFEMISSSQTLIPGTEDAATIQLREGGLDYRVSRDIPALVGGGIERCLREALAPLALAAAAGGWNSLFWAMHPGAHAVMDSNEVALRLEPGKMAASRRVLTEYGNMCGVTVIFVLDELRRSQGVGRCEWGVMVGFGPGITVEMMVLRASTPALPAGM